MSTTEGAQGIPAIDQTRPTYISYIDRSREYYLAQGFGNPYRWPHFQDVPFTRLARPLAQSRVALVTTARDRRRQPQGAGGPDGPIDPLKTVYASPIDPDPDTDVSHLGYDTKNVSVEDPNSYLPVARVREFVKDGRIGSLASCFYGVPSTRSQRRTIEHDAPELLRRCREDGVDVALLVPV